MSVYFSVESHHGHSHRLAFLHLFVVSGICAHSEVLAHTLGIRMSLHVYTPVISVYMYLSIHVSMPNNIDPGNVQTDVVYLLIYFICLFYFH